MDLSEFSHFAMGKEQQNPNSQKLPRTDSPRSWSELPPELVNLVFERLGFADFRRVGSVCWSWYSASRRCVTKKRSPWLILLPDEDDKKNNHSCTLLDPEEKGKLYKRRFQAVEFAKSVCLATCGSWLLVLDHWYNLYILNLFTDDWIYLPMVESQLGTTKVERTLDGRFRISKNRRLLRDSTSISMESPVFWIDDQTKDYVVVLGFDRCCVVYSKKGDCFWNQIPLLSSCSDMVYKDHKLYYLDFASNGRPSGSIKIFDFSGEIPRETFHCGVTATANGLDRARNSWFLVATKLVVTVTGDVLKVEKMVGHVARIWSFRIYKVYSPGGFCNKYEQVDSLGHEAMLFDLGITVLANDDHHVEGFKRNSIYFNIVCLSEKTTQICRFNLETQKIEPLHKFDCSSAQQLARARWFLPSFTQT